MNRRYFFGTALGALTAARPRAIAASDQVNVAIVGVGGRGRSLIGDFAKVPGANIRYLVDADQASLEKALGMVKKLLQQRRRTGEIAPRHYRSGRKPMILEAHHRQMRTLLAKKPDLTLTELREAVALECSLPAIHYALEKMGLTY